MLIKNLISNAAILVAFMFIGGEIFKDNRLNTSAHIKTKIFAGITGGLMGIILMLFSVNINSDFVLDLRQFAIIILAFHGGFIASLITGIIMIIFRVVYFGINTASIIAVLIVIPLSIICGFIGQSSLRKKTKWILMNLFGIIAINCVLCISLKDTVTLSITIVYFNVISIAVGFFLYYLSNYIVFANSLFSKYKAESKIADNLTDLITTHKIDGTYLYVSSSCKKILGYEPEELVGTNAYDFFHPKDLEIIVKSYSSIINTDSSYSIIYRIKRKDENYIWFETTSRGIKNKDGKVYQLICVSRDITKRKKAEFELEASHKKVNNILESIQDAFFALDKESCFTYLNKESELILGKNRDELIGKSMWDVYPKIVNTSLYKNYHKALNEQIQINFEEFYTPMNKWFSVRIYPSRDGVSVYYNDITDRKIAENKLTKSENRFRSLVNSMNDIVYTLDTEQRYIGIFGKWIYNEDYDKGDFIGKTSREILGAEVAKVHEEANLRTLKGEHVVYDWYIESQNKTQYYQTSLSPIMNEQNNIIGIVGVGRNVTEQKKIEKKLKEANDKLRNISLIDGLTNIPNRRCFDEALEREWDRMARNSTNLSLLLLDIDHFKAYNDTYGHLQGDECLKIIAKLLKESVNRASDIVARYGGEEFVVILPETTVKGAKQIANNIRKQIEDLRIPNINSKVKPYVTVSIGIANMIPSSISKYEELIKNSDKALYNAKENGRNRIEVYNKNKTN